MPYLAFNLNDGNEFIFDLLEDRLSLGRNPRNEIVIDNNQISSFHAEFARQANGAYLLTDLKSSNGTYVNSRRIESAELKPGDRVRFGQLEARFREMYIPGPGREKRGPAPSAEEKRRAADSSEGPRPQTDFIPIEKAPGEATAARNARPAPAPNAQPNVQPIAPTCPPPGSCTTIPKPTPAPVQIVARAPAPSAGRPTPPPPQTKPPKPPAGSTPKPAHMPAPAPAATTSAHELQEKLAMLNAEIAGAQAQLDKQRDVHSRELQKLSSGRAAIEKEQAEFAANLLTTREDVESLGRDRAVLAKELERLTAQCSEREDELTGLLARIEKLAATDSRLASAEEALKLVTEKRSAAETALDDLRTAHEQERKELDESKAGHGEAEKQHAETRQQIAHLRSEHALLEKTAAAARATAATAEAHAARVHELDTALASKQSALDAASGQLRELETRREEKEHEITTFAEQSAAQHTLLQTLSEQRIGLEERVAALERTLDDASKRLVGIESRATDLEGKSAASRAELENARAGVAQAAADLQSHRDETSAAVKAKEEHLATVTKLLEETSARHRGAESRAVAAEGEALKHQAKIDALLATAAEKASLVASLDERHSILTEAAERFTVEEASRGERLATLERQLAENTVNLEAKRAELAEAGERLSNVEKRSRGLEQDALNAQESLDAVKKQRHEGLVAVEELVARKEALRQELVRLEREAVDRMKMESSAAGAARKRQEELTVLEERVAAAHESLAQVETARKEQVEEHEDGKLRLATVKKLLEDTTTRHREAESQAIAAEAEAHKQKTALDALLATATEKASLVASLDERHGVLCEAAARFAAEEASRGERLATLEKQLAESTANLETKRAGLAEAGERLSTAEKKSQELEQHNSKAQASLDAVEKQLHEEKVAVGELIARREALGQDLVRIERETADGMKRESSAAVAARQRQEELTVLEERVAAARESFAQLEASHAEAAHALQAAKEKHLAEHEDVKSRLATVTKLLEETTTRQRESESQSIAAEAETRKQETALDALLATAAEKESLVASLDERHGVLCEAAARFAAEEASRGERLVTLERQLAENTVDLETKRAGLAEAGERLSTAEKKSQELEQHNLKAQASLDAVEKQLQEEKVAIEELTGRREALRRDLVRIERETADGMKRESSAAVAARQRREELTKLEERVATTLKSLAQAEGAHSESLRALQASKNEVESLQAVSAGLNMEVSAAQTALHELVVRRNSEEDRTVLLAAIAVSRQREIEETGCQLDGLRQQHAQGEAALRQLRDQIAREDHQLAAARSRVEATENHHAELQARIGERESTLTGRVAQLTTQVGDLRREEQELTASLQTNRERLRRGESSLEDMEKKLAANETRFAEFLQSGGRLLSLNEALSMMDARERAASRRLSDAAEQELSLQVKLSALNESIAKEQLRLDHTLRERAHEEEDHARALEKTGRDLEEAKHRAGEEAKLLEISLTTRLKERVHELEGKHEALRRSLQASTDEKTVILFANEIIKRIDLIDILIQRVTGPGINGGMEQQLRTLRASFEDILEAHGIAEFKVAPGTEVDAGLRQQIAIVESVSGPARTKVVESYRPGFIYSCEPGREVILRKVEVKTSSER